MQRGLAHADSVTVAPFITTSFMSYAALPWCADIRRQTARALATNATAARLVFTGLLPTSARRFRRLPLKRCQSDGQNPRPPLPVGLPSPSVPVPPFSYCSLILGSIFFQVSESSFAVQRYSVQLSS